MTKIEGFDKPKREGTKITLSKILDDEAIEIKFDVNLNKIMLEREEVEDETMTGEEDGAMKLVAYPEISVSIRKQSGTTLVFNCMCGMSDEEMEYEEMFGEEEEKDDRQLLTIINVLVLDPTDDDPKMVYENTCSDGMDEELHSMLLTTLQDRGVTGAVVNQLIEFSTAIDHRYHLEFLTSLQKFANDK